MLKLNLQQFAKTSSYMEHYRSSRRIAKESMPGQPAKSAKQDTSFMNGRVSGSEVKTKENYRIFRVNDANDRNERNPKNITGSMLRDMIAHNQLKYNARQRVWVSGKDKNVKFVVRKRK